MLIGQALRRAGAFENARYADLIPSTDDDHHELERKWKAWAQQESLKRSTALSRILVPWLTDFETCILRARV